MRVLCPRLGLVAEHSAKLQCNDNAPNSAHKTRYNIGNYIDSPAPGLDQEEKGQRAETRAAKAKAAKELSEDDLARIDEMLSKGISQRKIAEAMGVSQSFVQRKNRQPK